LRFAHARDFNRIPEEAIGVAMRLKAPYLLLFAGVLAFPLTASADWTIVERLCIGEKPDLPIVTPPIRGCLRVDCCPGCPGPLRWEMRFDGRVLDSLELRFEGLPPDGMRRLNMSGNAKLDGERILVSPGDSHIEGLSEVDGHVPVGVFRIDLDGGAAARLSALLDRMRAVDPEASSVPDVISVRQFFGNREVDRGTLRYRISACTRPLGPGDRLRVENIAAGDNVVVMMDSRASPGQSGCTNDDVRRTTGELQLGNVRAAAGCNSEIAVFATENAMALSNTVGIWTNSSGDIHTITMKPLIQAPVSYWIADAAGMQLVTRDVTNANDVYTKNKVGVRLAPAAAPADVSSNAGAVATIGQSCDKVADIRASAWYTPNRLNIYYVSKVDPPQGQPPAGPDGVPGWNCDRWGDANITFISATKANKATLVHEIGHAFGLRPGFQGGHTENEPGFGPNNVMWGGGSEYRDHFSLGQVFRMHMQADQWGGTMLIANGLRPGPGRNCPPRAASDLCPRLDLDWVRP
jgi:hypothetical protein